MPYKILLFDLDNTLLDFDANEFDSLTKLFAQRGYPLSDELRAYYNTVNDRLWASYERGEIPLDGVLNSRFPQTLRRLGIEADGSDWENAYRELLGNGSQLIDGAAMLCQSLSRTHRLFVITNGVTQTQHKRLREAGLSGFFEDVFTSQEIGFQKPSSGFFDYIAGHIRDFEKKDALIIGDSLNTDIKGGLLAGIDTCWFNRKGQAPSAEIPSTYAITALEELYDLLGLSL
jgi:2-haloacid dehalogenase